MAGYFQAKAFRVAGLETLVQSGPGLAPAEGWVGLLLLGLFQSESGEIGSEPEHLAAK